MLPELREYQIRAIQDIRKAFSSGFKAPLLVLPTGAGKGTIAASIVLSAVERGKRVIFLVNRREIVKDFSKRLDRLGVEHGIIMGQNTRGTHRPVQLASVDTLRNRPGNHRADLVFIDEAHFAVSESWNRVISAYRDQGSYFLLMTATPCRLDGRGLGSIADVLIQGPSVAELTEGGYLVPARVFAPSVPDLAGVHTAAGEYKQAELAAVMDKPRLVGNIVEHWKPFSDRPTVVFAVNCEHGRHIEKEFNDAGYLFRFVDSKTSDAERQRAWCELKERTISGVVSVGIISYGWDAPCVSCGILARPTRSISLYLQQCGRILRTFQGKRDSIILDHAGNTLRHGFIDDPQEWSLDDTRKRTQARCDLPPDLMPRVCPRCMAVSRPVAACECGYVFSTREVIPEHIDGQLTEVRRIYNDCEYGQSDDPGVQHIISVARERGWNPRAVWHKTKALETARSFYRERFNAGPKPHWNAAVINSMLAVQAKLTVVS